jgi:hypothetical protein
VHDPWAKLAERMVSPTAQGRQPCPSRAKHAWAGLTPVLIGAF